jgi:hypothetical protein
MATCYTTEIQLDNVDDFIRNFNALLRSHKENQQTHRATLGENLVKIGCQVRQGNRQWTSSDVNVIIRWRSLQPLRRRIEQGSVDLEKRLAAAIKQTNDEDRMNELCRIPGFGPVLASTILALTFPEAYGVLDNASWRVLQNLGFDLSSKPYSGGGYTLSEVLKYQYLLRTLGRMTHALPAEVADALRALRRIMDGPQVSAKCHAV